METIILSKDLWEVVEEGYEECSDKKSHGQRKDKEYKENVKKMLQLWGLFNKD